MIFTSPKARPHVILFNVRIYSEGDRKKTEKNVAKIKYIHFMGEMTLSFDGLVKEG